jgi:branched-chain amino acid transport system ATP-binding protein
MAESLEIRDLVVGYSSSVVLDRISLDLAAGESLALLGRNGVGKTTLIEAIAGRLPVRSGSIMYGSRDVLRSRPYERIRLGIGLVPQEREVFPSLTVDENLRIAARSGPWSLSRMYQMFPSLEARKTNLGNALSGGEQQMLAIARAMVGNPTLLLLDEPLEGLAPVIVQMLLEALERLERDGLTIILVEQHVTKALKFADNALVLDRGRVVHYGRAEKLAADRDLMKSLLSV